MEASAVTMTMEMMDAIIAYSIAVAPCTSPEKSFRTGREASGSAAGRRAAWARKADPSAAPI